MRLVLYTVRCGASRCLVTANSGRGNINCAAQIHDAAFWITRIKLDIQGKFVTLFYMSVRNEIFCIPASFVSRTHRVRFSFRGFRGKCHIIWSPRRVPEGCRDLLRERDAQRNTKIKRRKRLQQVSTGGDAIGKEERVWLHENKLRSRGENVRYVRCVLLSCQRFLAYCHFGVFRAACALKPYAYRAGWCHEKNTIYAKFNLFPKIQT